MIPPITEIDVPRHLDLAALRSFVAVADTGGVTRAAGFLHLTQSAVSMQIKRLEEALQVRLLDRTGRGVTVTQEGTQLLGYARRLLALNDEALGRMTHPDYEGEIVLGVPTDIVLPAIPLVLRAFAARHPRMNVHLVTSHTRDLRAQHARGEVDIALTTERTLAEGGEEIARRGLVWIGAPEGRAWRERPLPLAFERQCIFFPEVTRALEAAGIDWRSTTRTDSTRTVGAMVLADLAVHAYLDGVSLARLEPVAHGGALPPLPDWAIGLYGPAEGAGRPAGDMMRLLREAFAAPAPATAADQAVAAE